MGRLGVTSDQWAWSSVDSGWLGVGGLFGRAGALFTVVSAGTGAISGKGFARVRLPNTALAFLDKARLRFLYVLRHHFL